MDHTLALIGRIHQGDKEARDTLFSENMGLVYSVARRFQICYFLQCGVQLGAKCRGSYPCQPFILRTAIKERYIRYG